MQRNKRQICILLFVTWVKDTVILIWHNLAARCWSTHWKVATSKGFDNHCGRDWVQISCACIGNNSKICLLHLFWWNYHPVTGHSYCSLAENYFNIFALPTNTHHVPPQSPDLFYHLWSFFPWTVAGDNLGAQITQQHPKAPVYLLKILHHDFLWPWKQV